MIINDNKFMNKSKILVIQKVIIAHERKLIEKPIVQYIGK